jgi:hypothetical protein
MMTVELLPADEHNQRAINQNQARPGVFPRGRKMHSPALTDHSCSIHS